MQYFRDTETGALFAFDDDVSAVHTAEGLAFVGADGEPLPGPYPVTLVPTNDATPPAYVPTLAELQAQRDGLLQVAALRIAPLQDATDLGVATSAETAALTAWKQYRINVNRTDLSTSHVQWPDAPTQ